MLSMVITNPTMSQIVKVSNNYMDRIPTKFTHTASEFSVFSGNQLYLLDYKQISSHVSRSSYDSETLTTTFEAKIGHAMDLALALEDFFDDFTVSSPSVSVKYENDEAIITFDYEEEELSSYVGSYYEGQ